MFKFLATFDVHTYVCSLKISQQSIVTLQKITEIIWDHRTLNNYKRAV